MPNVNFLYNALEFAHRDKLIVTWHEEERVELDKVSSYAITVHYTNELKGRIFYGRSVVVPTSSLVSCSLSNLELAHQALQDGKSLVPTCFFN